MERSAIFLDRDGVINEVLSSRVKFVNKPSQFFLLDGVGEAIRLLNEKGFLVFVVTNQGGIGLGYMKEEQLIRVHEKMKRDLADYGATVNDIAYCPHKPKEGCECRKPNAKMITELAKTYHVDLKNSFMIGDREIDILAGKKAGTKTVLIGNEHADSDFQFSTLLDAARWIIQKGSEI